MASLSDEIFFLQFNYQLFLKFQSINYKNAFIPTTIKLPDSTLCFLRYIGR
jgi:hypothetical protein